MGQRPRPSARGACSPCASARSLLLPCAHTTTLLRRRRCSIGRLLTCTLLGDAALSLLITLTADHVGRRAMLLTGCGLKLLGGAIFAAVGTPVVWLLLLGATVGVISPSGNEVGPFMSLEMSMLSEQVGRARAGAAAAPVRQHAWHKQ